MASSFYFTVEVVLGLFFVMLEHWICLSHKVLSLTLRRLQVVTGQGNGQFMSQIFLGLS
jgi:hypothetical protein